MLDRNTWNTGSGCLVSSWWRRCLDRAIWTSSGPMSFRMLQFTINYGGPQEQIPTDSCWSMMNLLRTMQDPSWEWVAIHTLYIVCYFRLCVFPTRWRHQMETFSALLALCEGNSPVPVNSPLKGQWRGALMFSLICAWINNRVNNREDGDLSRHRAHYGITVMRW